MSALLTSDATDQVGDNRLFYMVYASRMTPKSAFTKHVFTDICDTSGRHNRAVGITGFLFFKNGKFFQYLEGEEAKVRGLYQKITQDPRNRQHMVLVEGYREQRLFPEWAMHCFRKDYDDNSHEIGERFINFDVMHWDESETLSAIQEVKQFYQHSNQPAQVHHHPRDSSYMGEWASSLTRQHATFILLQLVFIVLACIMMGYFILVK